MVRKGQALTEFALVILILCLLFLGAMDFVVFFANRAVGQYYAFQAAREASIYINDGTSCDQWVRSHMSQPIMLLVDSWTLTLSGCPPDPSWSPTSGSNVSATLSWHQKLVFWEESGFFGALANGAVVMRDITQ